MQTILIQLDTDLQPSVFDRVVAVDSGVGHLFSYSAVTPDTVTGLVHGAIFTRGPADLKNTAIFIGGGSAADGETLLKKVQKTFFGPMRVSVMMDSNGCNTTAAAAIASARRHMTLESVPAVVLGATGPVGLRAAELLAIEKSHVTLVSRTLERAESACAAIRSRLPEAQLTAAAADQPEKYEERKFGCRRSGSCRRLFFERGRPAENLRAPHGHRSECRPSCGHCRHFCHGQSGGQVRSALFWSDWCWRVKDESPSTCRRLTV